MLPSLAMALVGGGAVGQHSWYGQVRPPSPAYREIPGSHVPSQTWAEATDLIKPCAYIDMHLDMAVAAPVMIFVLLWFFKLVVQWRRREAVETGGCEVYCRAYPFGVSDVALGGIVICCAGIAIMAWFMLFENPARQLPSNCAYHSTTHPPLLRYSTECDACCTCRETVYGAEDQTRCMVRPYNGNPTQVMFEPVLNYNPDPSARSHTHVQGAACEFNKTSGDVCVDVATGVCAHSSARPYDTENGWCQLLCKDTLYNRYLMDGIEFNHTRLHARHQELTGGIASLFVFGFGLVMTVTKCFGGWAKMQWAGAIQWYQYTSNVTTSPKKTRPGQHNLVLVKHKPQIAPTNVACVNSVTVLKQHKPRNNHQVYDFTDTATTVF